MGGRTEITLGLAVEWLVRLACLLPVLWVVSKVAHWWLTDLRPSWAANRPCTAGTLENLGAAACGREGGPTKFREWRMWETGTDIAALAVAAAWPLWAATGWLRPRSAPKWRRKAAGLRAPSPSEMDLIRGALARVEAAADRAGRQFVAPRHVWIEDGPHLNAWVGGADLAVTGGLLRSDDLTAVLAHEAGHLVGPEARADTAARGLVAFPLLVAADRLAHGPLAADRAGIETSTGRRVGDVPGCVAGWAATGMRWASGSPLVTLIDRLPGGPVAALSREVEAAADDYAAACGFGGALADHLEAHGRAEEGPRPWRDRTHPPNAWRIDRLRGDTRPPTTRFDG